MSQIAVDLMRSQFKMAHDWLLGTMQSVSTEQAHFQPGGKAACIAAHYAHVITGEDLVIAGMFFGKTPLITGEFADKSGLSSPPPSGAWDAWARDLQVDLLALNAYAAAVFAQTDAILAGMTDADLAAPRDLSSWGMGEQPTSFVLNLFVGNAFAHCGEISCIKGLQGETGYPF